MIRVVKPAQAPEILLTRGADQTRQDCTAYDAGERSFEFDSEIYGHESVRQALLDAQHDKCCFCESKIAHVSYGDVEHFRPKAGVHQSRDQSLVKPGYYWLAYAWSNLYCACQLCNQRNKANLFPLAAGCARARSHHEAAELAAERPLFIEPGDDQVDPEQLIGFRDGEPYAIDGNPRAQETITALELGREELMERRYEHFKLCELLIRNVLSFRAGQPAPVDVVDVVDDTARYLARATRDDAEYASAIRSLLRDRLGQGLSFPIDPEALVAYVHGGSVPI